MPDLLYKMQISESEGQLPRDLTKNTHVMDVKYMYNGNSKY